LRVRRPHLLQQIPLPAQVDKQPRREKYRCDSRAKHRTVANGLPPSERRECDRGDPGDRCEKNRQRQFLSVGAAGQRVD
jgi:hypothetical protein